MAILERSHLSIMRAVEQQGSLTAAAEALHLTQSALSHTMRKLEAQLGVAIWHREGRSLRPTLTATFIAPCCRWPAWNSATWRGHWPATVATVPAWRQRWA